MTDASQKLPLPDSTFHMLRCVTAIVHADDVVNKEERQFLKTLVTYFEGNFIISDAHKVQLMQDLQIAPEIDDLLPQVTDRKDRENLVLFAGMLAKADGEVDPSEEVVLKKIRRYQKEHANEVTVAAAPAQAVNAPPVVNLDLLANEVREIVQQEFYREGLQKSGIERKSSVLSVTDAFVERGNLIHPDVFDALTVKKKPSVSTQRTLMQKEKLLSRARFHYTYIIKAFLLSALAGWFTDWGLEKAYALIYSMQQSLSLPPVLLHPAFWYWALMLGGWAVFVAIMAYKLLVWWATEIILTDRRLLFKEGVIFVKYTKIDLRQLFETVVNQSRLGAMLNYGSVFIYSNMVDTSIKGDKYDRNIVLPCIDDPHGFATRVDRAKRILRATGDQP